MTVSRRIPCGLPEQTQQLRGNGGHLQGGGREGRGELIPVDQPTSTHTVKTGVCCWLARTPTGAEDSTFKIFRKSNTLQGGRREGGEGERGE